MEKREKCINFRLLCLKKSKPIGYSCTCEGTVHLHFAQGERLAVPGDDHVHEAAVHAAPITVVGFGFTGSEAGDGSTPESGGCWGIIVSVILGDLC